MRSRCFCYVAFVTLSLCIVSCGEETEEVVPKIDTITFDEDAPVPPRDTGYSAQNEEIFEEIVHKEYAHLMGQVPRKRLDSLINAALKKNPDPNEAVKEAEKYLKEEQSETVLHTLSVKYDITKDSVQAIVDEVNAKNRAK